MRSLWAILATAATRSAICARVKPSGKTTRNAFGCAATVVVETLKDAVAVPVVLYDERFTTELARQTTASAPVDALAAAHLLTDYLRWSSAAPA